MLTPVRHARYGTEVTQAKARQPPEEALAGRDSETKADSDVLRGGPVNRPELAATGRRQRRHRHAEYGTATAWGKRDILLGPAQSPLSGAPAAAPGPAGAAAPPQPPQLPALQQLPACDPLNVKVLSWLRSGPKAHQQLMFTP